MHFDFYQISEELGLFEKIMAACQENHHKARKGFVAVLINMANAINENSEEFECFKKFIITSNY